MAGKRIRKRAKKSVVVKPAGGKKKKSAAKMGQAAQVAALSRKLASLQVNTSPFAATGNILGGRIGALFGNSGVGSNVGSWLGSGIGKIFGSGAYKMSQNSLWSTSDQVPVMHSTSESVVIRHREFIQNVNSSTTFVVSEFAINPGLISTFPWLASIASNFQEYNFKGLVFEFKSTSADALNSTNTALGTMAMAIQYRAGATSFTTKQQVLNEMWSADSKPANSFFMPVECAPAECPMDIQYIRTGALGSSDDIKFYDLGKLALCSDGSQAASVVGELWASYEVCLRKPILGGGIGNDVLSASIYRTGVDSTVLLGNNTALSGINSAGVTFPSGSRVVIPASPKKFLCVFQWLGAVGTWVLPPIASASNVTYVLQNAQTAPGNGVGTNSNGCTYSIVCTCTDLSLPMYFQFNSGTFQTPCYLYLNITEMDFDDAST